MKKTYIAPYIDVIELPEHVMVTEGTNKGGVTITIADDDEELEEDPNGARWNLWDFPDDDNRMFY